MRQAIGTMADAVSDEIDGLRKEITTEVDSKLNTVTDRVQNVQLNIDNSENEQAKLKFQLD